MEIFFYHIIERVAHTLLSGSLSSAQNGAAAEQAGFLETDPLIANDTAICFSHNLLGRGFGKHALFSPTSDRYGIVTKKSNYRILLLLSSVFMHFI